MEATTKTVITAASSRISGAEVIEDTVTDWISLLLNIMTRSYLKKEYSIKNVTLSSSKGGQSRESQSSTSSD
jgi:hypothetical protein